MNNISKLLLLAAALLSQPSLAQTNRATRGIPLTLSVFTESVSIPNLRHIGQRPNLGLRIGTELYYRNRSRSQLMQTVNLGFYHHQTLHNGLYLNTQFGYRKFIGSLYLDGLIGVGALGLQQQLRSYERTETGDFRPASRFLVRVMPSLSLGVGYQLRKQSQNPVSIFSQYDAFAEMPFNNGHVPLLPHAAFHLGVRLSVNR